MAYFLFFQNFVRPIISINAIIAITGCPIDCLSLSLVSLFYAQGKFELIGTTWHCYV